MDNEIRQYIDDQISTHVHDNRGSRKIKQSDILDGIVPAGENEISLLLAEDFNDREIGCIKPAYTDYSPTHDSYVYQGAATTNYGNETDMYVGKDGSGNDYFAYLKWSATPWVSTQYIIRAELHLPVVAVSGTPPTQNLQRITADWDESTITWNAKPTVSDDIHTTYGNTRDYTASAGSTSVIDITFLVRQWKAGNAANHGVRINGNSGSGDYFRYGSFENATASNRPFLRIYTSQNTTSQVHLAKCSDYLFCRTIAGIAKSAGSSGSSINFAAYGKINGMSFSSNIGDKFYLSSTAGAYTFDSTNLTNIIQLGRTLTATTGIIEPNNRDILIESVGDILSAGTAKRFYLCSDTRYIVVKGYKDDSPDHYDFIRFPRGINATFGSGYVSNGQYHTITWGTNYVEIDPIDTVGDILGIYFYN